MKCNFSLESYEQYSTSVFRPRRLAQPFSDPDAGRFTYVEVAWNEGEPSRGAYRLEGMKEAIAAAINPVLVLRPVLPLWAKEDPAGYFAAFIRKVGSDADSEGRLAGIVIVALSDSKEEWNAYMDSFQATPLLADLHHTALIHHLRERNREFGLLVTCSESTWIDCCEAFATQQLHHVWRSKPVVLHVTEPSSGPSVEREALRWHASLANISMELGGRLELRRMTYSSSVTSGGSLPLRLWFVNTGSSRLYREFELRLRLKREDATYVIPVRADSQAWLTGDLVHNEVLRIPEVTEGDYSIALGLFLRDGSPIRLHIQDQEDGGYYEAGTLRVESPGEDPLLRIWETYYPEGYYPLEDPKVPESNSVESDNVKS
ncbi:DUF4832 domain-containing protein [Cohnella lupini]|uniref:Uncharacterized protein DUF4832 n=1 Tax=Cohnella lupini TaxID=1294267 RepID=A0A3D9IX11_9BACL|nr:DUF4832 domain-containing protein [Cohnella lupini]RED66348.1 uncharacterized protein DUF4832 [Cohnella lupini]